MTTSTDAPTPCLASNRGRGPPPDAGADGPALTAGFGATRYGPACALVTVRISGQRIVKGWRRLGLGDSDAGWWRRANA